MPDPAVRIRRLRALGMIALRAPLDDAAVAGDAAAALGLAAAPEVRRVARVGTRAAAWMSPDEWLVLCPPEETGDLCAVLSAVLAGRPRLVAEVSDARAAFSVEGPGARATLAKGAPADLSPAAFRPGAVRRTRLGQVAAAILMEAEAPEDRLTGLAARSVAEHVALWLQRAAQPGRLPRGF